MCGQVHHHEPEAAGPGGGPPRGGRCRLLGFFLLSSLLCSPAQAQTAAGDNIFYSQRPAFNIPFQTDPGERRVQQVRLYVSLDQGRTWQQTAAAPPTERFFRFQARQDGWHWFAVQTIDFQNQAFPPSVEQLQPGIKVCVDTQKPGVVLRSVQPPEGGVGVEWQVADENLDLNSLRLEVRTQGTTGEWTPINVERLAVGRRSWHPGTNAPLEVRLQVRDRAGNVGEAVTQVTPGAGGNPARPPAPAAPGPGEVRRVNSTRISLNYDLKEVGKYGVSKVELWYTRDPQARTWQKHTQEQIDPKPPYLYPVEVSEEGLYGFTLVARNKVGMAEKTPDAGDPPQVWVEVDLTKPKVQLLGVEVGKGIDQGKLTITWSASDKNLDPRPITLSYAEKLDGPWIPIASGEANTGRYVWQMPNEVPHEFFVRVDAVDLARNVGTATAQQTVKVDLSRPKTIVIGVEPAVAPPPDRPQ